MIPPILKAITAGGKSEIIVPAIGTKLRRKIINPRAINCGNPKILRAATDSMLLVIAISICA
jgi:hypothetical protein